MPWAARRSLPADSPLLSPHAEAPVLPPEDASPAPPVVGAPLTPESASVTQRPVGLAESQVPSAAPRATECREPPPAETRLLASEDLPVWLILTVRLPDRQRPAQFLR